MPSTEAPSNHDDHNGVMNRSRRLTHSTHRHDDEEPPLSDRPPDEHAVGWSEPEPDQRDRDWYERERPPHHE
jgi:hypothetical protein